MCSCLKSITLDLVTQPLQLNHLVGLYLYTGPG